jgi:heat-inducible transcriptional repressor
MVVSRVIEIEEPLSRDEALSLAHFLNTELAGLSAYELLASLERRLLAVSDSFYHLVKRSLQILQTALATEPEERFFLDGTAYLFEQPEFQRHPERVHELVRQLETQEALVQRLRADLETDGMRTRIGHELDLDGLEDCSYVLSPERLNAVVVGGVGVLGPRRMDYRRMRALTEGVTEILTSILTHREPIG